MATSTDRSFFEPLSVAGEPYEPCQIVPGFMQQPKQAIAETT